MPQVGDWFRIKRQDPAPRLVCFQGSVRDEVTVRIEVVEISHVLVRFLISSEEPVRQWLPRAWFAVGASSLVARYEAPLASKRLSFDAAPADLPSWALANSHLPPRL